MKLTAVMFLAVTLALGFTYIRVVEAVVVSQQACVYSADCHTDECAVSDVRGGMKCVPKYQPYMVWKSTCIKSLGITEGTTVEAPLDSEGNPEWSKAVIRKASAEVRPDCGHTENR